MDARISNKPSSTTSSNEWPNFLNAQLLANVRTQLEWPEPSPIQQAALSEFESRPKCDLLLSARPGSGKTGAFLLPVLDKLLKKLVILYLIKVAR